MAAEDDNEKFEQAVALAELTNVTDDITSRLNRFKVILIKMAKQNETEGIVGTAEDDIKLSHSAAKRLKTALIDQFGNQQIAHGRIFKNFELLAKTLFRGYYNHGEKEGDFVEKLSSVETIDVESFHNECGWTRLNRKSPSTVAPSETRSLVRDFYGVGKNDCFLLGSEWVNAGVPDWFTGDVGLRLAHLYPRSQNDIMKSDLLSFQIRRGFVDGGGFADIADVHDKRNLMILYAPIERAFDKGKLGFIYLPLQQDLKCVVFDYKDQWLMDHCHNKICQMPKLKEGNRPCLRILAFQFEFGRLRYWYNNGGHERLSEQENECIELMMQLSLDLSDKGSANHCHACEREIGYGAFDTHCDDAKHIELVSSKYLSQSDNKSVRTIFGDGRITHDSHDNNNNNNDKNRMITVKMNKKSLKIPIGHLGYFDTRGPIHNKTQKFGKVTNISFEQGLDSNARKWRLKRWKHESKLFAHKKIKDFFKWNGQQMKRKRKQQRKQETK